MAKSYEPLRMIAADTDDITVLSAVFQDAVLKIVDMAWLPKQRRFVLVANRFVWEDGIAKKHGPFTRVRSGMHFDDVTNVRTRNLKLDAKQAVVSLLAIRFETGEDGAGTVHLELSGGGEIALEVEAINAETRDISEPWRTRHKPAHPLD